MNKIDEFIGKLKSRLSVFSDCKLRIEKDDESNILRIYIISDDGDKSYCDARSYLDIINAYDMDVIVDSVFVQMDEFYREVVKNNGM